MPIVNMKFIQYITRQYIHHLLALATFKPGADQSHPRHEPLEHAFHQSAGSPLAHRVPPPSASTPSPSSELHKETRPRCDVAGALLPIVPNKKLLVRRIVNN